MLTEFSGFEDVELATLLPLAGVLLGLLFGAIAQRSRFCLRSAVIESAGGRLAPMAGVYAAALLTALLGAQALSLTGFVALDETRFHAEEAPLGALVLGGLMFGIGMVLTRGCASRLTVLSAQGNLRALIVILLFGATAYATLRGALAPARVALSDATMVAMPAGAAVEWVIGCAAILLTGTVIALARPSLKGIAAGMGIGALVAAAWFATGALLFDEFDPIEAQALAFTSGASDALFYTMAATALEPTFAAGVFGGALLGSFSAAAVSRELRLEGFENANQTGRYLIGAVLMGAGGVLAGGCTIGAGLTGASTLALAPFIALAAIIAGALIANRALAAENNSQAGIVAAE